MLHTFGDEAGAGDAGDGTLSQGCPETELYAGCGEV